MTYDFTTVTEVTLASGAHANPQEGLCFMEMVAWFAGEEHSDEPQCACPVLGRYGIGLNDRMPTDLRDRLLKPLVPMIAGTRGTRDDERRRAEFLAMWTINRILPSALRAIGLKDHGDACATAATLPAARAAADAARAAADAARAAAYAYAADAADAADAAADAYAADAADAADAAAYAYAADAADAADAYAAREEVFATAVEGLRQAILIGPHEGFDRLIDLPARHTALKDLVQA